MRLYKFLGKNPKKKDEIFQLIIRPDFNEAVEVIRKKFGIDSWDGESQATEESERTFLAFMEDSKLNDDIDLLIKKFRISSRWRDVIMQYVVDGNFIPSNYDPDGLILEINLDTDSDRKYLLRITKDTDINDIRNVWLEIKKTVGAATRKREWKNFYRDYDIYRMAASKKYDVLKIRKFIKEKYGEDLESDHIITIESRFRKRIGITKRYKKHKLKLWDPNLR